MTTPEPTPVPAAAPVAPKTNTLAIVALVLGILGFNIITVIIGHIALSQIKKTGEAGKPLAIIGLVLGYIGVVVIAIFILFAIIAAATGNVTVSTY